MTDSGQFITLSPMPHAVLGFDGVIRSVNEAWSTFFSGRPDSFMSEPIFRLVEHADRPEFLSTWKTLEPSDATVRRTLRAARGPYHGEKVVWLFRTQRDDEVVIVTVVEPSRSELRGESVLRDQPPVPGFDASILGALDDLGTGLAVVDNEEFVWVNDALCRSFGYTPSEIVGRTAFDLVAEHDRDVVRGRHRRRVAGEMVSRFYEFDGVKRDGTVIRIEMAVQYLRGDPRNRTIVMTRDITERTRRREHEARARRLQSLGELAASLGREYNNIVMAYKLLSDGLRDRVGDEHASAPEFDRLEEVTRRALTLTRRLITLEGRPLSNPAHADLNVLAWEAVEAANAYIDAEVVPRLTPGLPTIVADRDQIESLLEELLDNAARASEPGSIILVETGERVVTQDDPLDESLQEGRYLVIRVADDGEGIPEEILEHVVEPFFTTRPLEASGLGLANAYGIVRGLGGHLTISSRERFGTRVEVFLPVDSDAEAVPRPRRPSKREIPETIEVMVVDTSEVLRELLQRELERAGYSVTTAATPVEAFASLQGGQPCDVMVAELVAAGGDGFDFVRRLRGERLDLCIVLTSGRSGVRADELAIEVPNLTFLQKPFSAERLDREIKSALAVRTDIV